MTNPPIHRLRDDIAVVGWACRLPGAKSVDQLWSLLLEGRCAVSRVPEDRFSLDRFGHPRRQEKGKSYTWAAGILDDIWGFDPAVFGISPREAVQIDPQQRILLQLTWEALEDAGIRPSSIANSEVGVFIGASQTDYGHAFFSDPAIADAHFAPGTAVAILANRISYAYGLHGPSITVDTACSSALIALHQAIEAIRSGRIDTAIVGGSNLIASPASFIAFSQANMLSPTGLCQAFSASADGFVRAEGAVIFIIRKAAHAQAQQNPIHGLILATDVNSDGRTNGISLPNLDAQEALLHRIYSRNRIDPDRLAFIEAHGTGTPVGDPVEATAIGRSIGQKRANPLPIGSIKTNIGHLEPASGLAGALKAMLSLNHGLLPSSLHFSKPNPNIEFGALNLNVCTQPLLLSKSAEQYAGVNSFGFGGTNAHAVVAAGTKAPAPAVEHAKNGYGVFSFSANSSGALTELARKYHERVNQLSDQETATIASAIIHRRERQSNRIVISSTRTEDVSKALDAFISGSRDPMLMVGTAIGDGLPAAFVYSGNGGQWVGMGRAAYRNNTGFRTRFEQVDSYFKQIGGWSLKEALLSDALQERLPLTSVAQPIIFAIQSACTEALRANGLKPAVVLGHSVGEVAAAEAAGILDLRTAIKVIHFRSAHQEQVRGAGRMAVVLASAATVQQLIDKIEGVEIAAINNPRAVTVAGTSGALTTFMRLAKQHGIALVDLDLDYPFHTTLMAPVEGPLEADLRDIQAHDADVPLVSTVTGACLPGSRLDGSYWWRNVREPVQFSAAVLAAAELGARYFIEIGPRATLLKHITDSLQGAVNGCAIYAVLDRIDEDSDPFAKARAHAIVTGARVETDKIFGQDPGPGVPLPFYPWQQNAYRFKPTVEAICSETERHLFAGARSSGDSLEWRAHIDTVLFPKLSDHRLGEQTIFPGTGFLEIALTVARQWLRSESIIVTNFEILSPLDLTNGETRELLTRVSPGSNTLEIFSRPRLSQVHWLLHCRCKIQTGNAASTASAPARPTNGHIVAPAMIYDLADASGLHYGPAFRLVEKVTVHDARFISVNLGLPEGESAFLLDPIRLDCAAHGIFTLFKELRAIERGVTYIPVRLEEVDFYRPHLVPERALIEITSKSERSIVANCYIYGKGEQIVAILRGARCQAVPIRREVAIDAVAFVEVPQLIDGTILAQTGTITNARDIVAGANSLDILVSKSARSTEREMLVEGWAMAAAYEIALALADNKTTVDVEKLIVTGRVPESLRNWMTNILIKLEAADLAKRQDSSWTLVHDRSLPHSASVVKALVTEQPSYASETLLAAAISGFARQFASGGTIAAPDSVVAKTALDFYNTASIALHEASDTLYQVLLASKQLWAKNRALRVLQVGFAPLTQSLLASQLNILLTVFEPDRRRYEDAELALARGRQARLVEHADELGEYDLIVAVAGLHRLPQSAGVTDLKRMLSPGGVLVAIEPAPSLFRDLVFGLAPHWFLPGPSGQPLSPLHPLGSWPGILNNAGFRNSQVLAVHCGSDLGYLIAADAEPVEAGEDQVPVLRTQPGKEAAAFVVAATGGCELADKLAARLTPAGWPTSSIVGVSDIPAVVGAAIVLVSEITDKSYDPVAALTQRCLEIKSFAERIADTPAMLWLVFSGALAVDSSEVRPAETGAWAFSRTLANEFPKLDVRRINIAPHLSAEVAAEYIRRIVTSGTRETELHVDDHAVRAVRVTGLKRALEMTAAPRRAAAKLERRSAIGQRLSWQPMSRRRPGPGEVEIEVEAVGLNFRDLMLSLSLLPEEMLEDGFSGATLGLECAGRIAQVGSGVENLNVGDRVMAFAAASFATHVTISSDQATKLPESVSCLAATTIPVAFFTAYYSLVTQAKLARRDWVLIHGGAGAVGMAAIQIAQLRGSRVIATAGSPAKRDLLRALGVAHVLDSRSTSFVDDIRKITKVGVDVILNSLAGEAMERSIACLRPFGRFVEIGKRDYATNSHIGLRPFRKNLTYFGVDVDQVIRARKALGHRIFSKIVREFEKGALVPLPYSVFDADDVPTAFHLIQQSGHIGKIVVRPPTTTLVGPAKKPFHVRADGTHIITGAFGGFGLETAKWLVEKGARYLVMLGRRGAASPEAQAVLQNFIARGVKILSTPCDVTDRHALEQLFEIVHSTMPPVVGVIHAAMVLDDGILANLDAERFHRVLAPKVAGAENLDALARGERLDYFVLFSSVTTLIGNPGQANYVAANGYLEGLARRRRQKGLPALAIGWGPILDVGVVAQNERLQSGLKKLTGVTGMRAREALELMAQALEQRTDIGETAVMTISPSEGSFKADRLAVLRSPTYDAFISAGQRPVEGSESINLLTIAAKDGVEAARRKVADVVAFQLAHVLHLREEEISQVRPLGEIGLDSLMALELVMNLEEAFGIQIPMSGSSGAMTIADIADEIIAHAGLDRDRDDTVVATLAKQHHTDIDAGQLEALKSIKTEETRTSKRLLS